MSWCQVRERRRGGASRSVRTSFAQRPRVEVAQAGRTLWSGRLRRLVPGRSAALPHAWAAAVDPAGGPVSVRLVTGG